MTSSLPDKPDHEALELEILELWADKGIFAQVRSKNEHSYLTPVAAAWGGTAIARFSAAATLVGLEAPPAAMNLEIKPYAIAGLSTDFLASPSHELRTLLNAILGYPRMLRTGILGPERYDKGIETIERNATSLTQMV